MTSEYAFAQWMKARRRALGVSQDELARRIEASRSNISQIESGQRSCSPHMCQRIRKALGEYPSVVLDRNRQEILDAARKHGIDDVRVFGSIARGTDRYDSDVDLLVRLPATDAATALSRFTVEARRILATRVDVLSNHDFAHIGGDVLRTAQKEGLLL